MRFMDVQVIIFFMKTAGRLNLLGGVLLYALGVGIARYLGAAIDWGIVLIGQVWVTTFQLGSRFLAAYFLLPTIPRDPSRVPLNTDSNERDNGLRRDLLLWVAFASFAATTSLTILLRQIPGIHLPVLVVMGVAFTLAILYAVPPFRLATGGYGDLIQAITMANLVPALGYILQTGELHQLVILSTFPLTTLYLAMSLALQLPRYMTDMRQERDTMLVRLGWERGMVFHNMLILGSFLVVGIAMLFDLPPRIALPAFFVFPLGLFQIWYMTRIAAGIKPNWRILRWTGILTFGLFAYLVAFSFWVR
jgi:1,4-dihydroxy-2-naphthoate octaprenyltransferase